MKRELPSAVDFERSVLGACLLMNGSIDIITDIITEDCFHDEKNRFVWMAMMDLYKSGKPIDLLSVKNTIQQHGNLEKAGGILYLVDLTGNITSNANIEYHARIVVEHYLRRQMIKISSKAIAESFDDSNDVFDLYQKTSFEFDGALNRAIKYDAQDIGKIHRKNIEESRYVVKHKISSGVPTGYRNLDNFINGWQKTDLIILAGRPAMGKSVCGLSFCLNPALKENIPTALFSLEMSNEQLVGRAQSNLSFLDSSRIIKKQLTEHEIDTLEDRCKSLNAAPIFIDDSPNLSLIEFKGKARRLVKERGVRLIVIDYLQLMVAETKKNANREQEVSQISRGLKALAKELQIPIIALSQLNRVVETRTDKRPSLSDLRESGSIEQDADMVMFCYRPEYYEIPSYEINGETISSEGLMLLIVAKHRAGSLGELRFGFNGELTKLENYDTYVERKRYNSNAQQRGADYEGGERDVPF